MMRILASGVRFAVLFLLACLLMPANPAAASPPPKLTPAEATAWRQDLQFLATELPRRHRDLYRRTSQAEFDAAVRALDARIPGMARHEVIVGLARIVALAPDGHTGIPSLLYESPARFRYLPVAMYLFKDGLYVYAADPRYAAAVGGRVVRIGRTSTEEAIAAVAPLIPRDNDMNVMERAPLYLACPEVLHALGLVEDMERVPLIVEKGGKKVRVELVPVAGPKPHRDNWALGQRFSKLDGWVDSRRPGQTPLWLRDPTDYFRSEYLDESRTLYAQYNEVADKPDTSVRAWVAQLQEVLRTRPVDRLVLDLRWNTGGNNYLNKPLLLALIKAEVNQRGRLFAIIGRRTFSATQNLVNDLDAYTETIFVGEPTAGSPNFFGDPAGFTLPNSGLPVRAATLWWQDADPRDRRKWTAPDLAVPLGFADYRDNRDPALETILAYRPGPPLDQQMLGALDSGGVESAVRIYETFRADPLNLYANTEGMINALGYRLLGARRLKEAVAMFELNVRSYPSSPNAYDSLAEAQAEAGDREGATRNYRKVLELDPGNANATERLRALEAGG